MTARTDTLSNTRITTPRGDLPAYVGRPTQPGPWPGVVVIHDAFGMTSAAKKHVDWLAEQGFLAAAPSLFHAMSGGMIACVKTAMREIAARSGPMFDDVEATRAWLATQQGCSGKVGVIGFCMGGGFAIALATGGTFAASSPNYGRLPKDADRFLKTSCPIVASYGAKDSGLKGVAARLEDILTKNGVPHDVKEYPQVGHSFMDDHGKGELPWLMVALSRVFSVGYNDAAAADARLRVKAFFDQHLKA